MTFVGHRKREGSNSYLFYGEWNNVEVKFPCQITGGTIAIKANFQNSPNGKKQVVKITYLPFLFIEYLEFSKIHCNLFNFKIQIILVKVGFYFLLSIVLKKWLLMVFLSFFKWILGHGYDLRYFCLFLA